VAAAHEALRAAQAPAATDEAQSVQLQAQQRARTQLRLAQKNLEEPGIPRLKI
jgi:hypothetical protein